MTPWLRNLSLKLTLAATPLWLDPLAWWLAFSPNQTASYIGLTLASLELIFCLVLLAALVAFVACPICLFFRSTRSKALMGVLCAVVFTASFIGGLYWRIDVQKANLVHVTERGQPLINAIVAYEADHGHAPAALEELVPKYIDHIPETGIGAFPHFWYHLGKPQHRHGNERILVVTPPSVVMGFDAFIYYPRQNYADAGYEPIENWGYFHD